MLDEHTRAAACVTSSVACSGFWACSSGDGVTPEDRVLHGRTAPRSAFGDEEGGRAVTRTESHAKAGEEEQAAARKKTDSLTSVGM